MTALILLAILLILIGVSGTLLPALPFLFAGTWLLAYSQDYLVIGSFSVLIVGLICAFGMAMDFMAGVLGAKYTGASKEALWGAAIGGVAGIFFSIPGMIFGPLLGAALGEFLDKRNLLLAGKVGIGTLIGFILGTIAKIGAALVVVLIILAQYIGHWLA